jgi:mycoredoxin
MYASLWCPDCRCAKNFLKKRGVAFDEVNVEEDPEGEEIVMRANNDKL